MRLSAKFRILSGMKLKRAPTDIYEIGPLIERVKRYAKDRGIAASTASFHVFGDGTRLSLLEDGKTVTVKTAKAAWERLNELEAQAESAA